jgi:hypothetical protein
MLFAQLTEPPLDPRGARAQIACGIAVESALLRLQRVDLSEQLVALLFSFRRQPRVNAVGTVHGGEDRVQPVVVLHLHGIEFVMMALCALDRGAGKNIEHG